MRRLRKLEKAVYEYELLLTKNQDEVKKNKDFYANDIADKIQDAKDFIKSEETIFLIWCNENINSFFSDRDNILEKAKKAINMLIANYHLNKISGILDRTYIMKEALERMQIRVKQYQYMIH